MNSPHAKPWLTKPAVTRGRIAQSVCNWCYLGDHAFEPMTLDQLCIHAKRMGIRSVELVSPSDWPTLKKHGLVCALAGSHGFVRGWNDPKNWPECRQGIERAVDDCAAAGFPNVITFSGLANGIPDDVGLANTVAGLKTVVGYAERHKTNILIEMLNSRIDNHPMKGVPDYMADTIEWCVEVCRQVGSPRLKLLFDIFHVQIMQGDIITRIRTHQDLIGHYHVAGSPERNELDENQEINYPPIMRAILETGYTGYVAQEFIPTREPVRGLWEAVRLCDV